MEAAPEIETKEPCYNCTECSSPIEILYISQRSIKFKCFNKTKSHKKKMKIKEYLENMVYFNNNWNIGKCYLHNHKQYESYCLECKEHLCENCLQSRKHLFHRKVNPKEIILTQKELKDLDKLLKYMKDGKEFKNLYDLVEIIYDTYKKYNNNYYYYMNIQFILNDFFDGYKFSQYNLSKKEYENSAKIKEEKENEKEIQKEKEINKMKSDYENEISNLKTIINCYETKLSNLEEANKKLSKEIKELKNKISSKNNTNLSNSIQIDYSQNKNEIRGVLDVRLKKGNDKIVLFNTDIKSGITVYLNNQKMSMIKDKNKRKIDYYFKKDGKYEFKIVFKQVLVYMKEFFSNCSNIISLDFSDFDASKLADITSIFYNCTKLQEIKGINKFINNKEITMDKMFQAIDSSNSNFSRNNSNTLEYSTKTFNGSLLRRTKSMSISEPMVPKQKDDDEFISDVIGNLGLSAINKRKKIGTVQQFTHTSFTSMINSPFGSNNNRNFPFLFGQSEQFSSHCINLFDDEI